MKEGKKLFRRDKLFWICAAGVIGLILVWALLKYYEEVRIERELYQVYLETGAYTKEELAVLEPRNWTEIVQSLYSETAWLLLLAAGLMQLVKWQILEGGKRKELGYLLPVKSVQYLTYDLISGGLLIWVPLLLYAVLQIFSVSEQFQYDLMSYLSAVGGNLLVWLSVGSFLYALLMFARTVANDLPDALVAVLLIWVTLNFTLDWLRATIEAALPWLEIDTLEFAQIFSFSAYNSAALPGYVPGKWQLALILAILTLILIAFAYACDKRKDRAGTGGYAFRWVRYLMIALSFAAFFEIFCICTWDNHVIYDSIPLTSAAAILSALLSAVVCAGINYLIKPAAYKS